MTGFGDGISDHLHGQALNWRQARCAEYRKMEKEIRDARDDRGRGRCGAYHRRACTATFEGQKSKGTSISLRVVLRGSFLKF